MDGMVGFDLEIAEDLPEDGNIDWSVPLALESLGLAQKEIPVAKVGEPSVSIGLVK